LAQGSSGRVFSAMQAERSLLAKTLCLVALIGAVYVLATGMPNTATGAFSMAPSVRPAQATPEAVSRAVGVWMDGGALDKVGKNVMPQWTGKETSPYNKMIQKRMAEREANLAKAEDLRLAFKQRNPDNQPLPGFLPFGEKMMGGKDEQRGDGGRNYPERGA